MKVSIIVAYFGEFPNYFQLFLESCKNNSKYDWIIFSDNMSVYDYPPNVHLINMSFNECQQYIQTKFDFTITLQTPQKLCDYKCAYGMIFEEYIREYDWWGHCDLDQIFGDLSHFINEDFVNGYDKIFSLGHLTLYKNEYDNNRMFMQRLNGRERFKEVFTCERGCGFDEWLPENVNDIYLESKRPVYLRNLCADINPYKMTFSLVEYDVSKRQYRHDIVKNSIFKYENGCIYQEYKNSDGIQRKEYPYIHLQKRNMKDKRTNNEIRNYYIIPNCFVDVQVDPQILLYMCKIWRIVNIQFLKVKWKSFKYRVKSGDWEFFNVFRKK